MKKLKIHELILALVMCPLCKELVNPYEDCCGDDACRFYNDETSDRELLCSYGEEAE